MTSKQQFTNNVLHLENKVLLLYSDSHLGFMIQMLSLSARSLLALLREICHLYDVQRTKITEVNVSALFTDCFMKISLHSSHLHSLLITHQNTLPKSGDKSS